MIVSPAAKKILLVSMYGSASQTFVVPDVVTSGTSKQTYKAPSFRPPANWLLGFAFYAPSQNVTTPVPIQEMPLLQVPNSDTVFGAVPAAPADPQYMTNKVDLVWEPATDDSPEDQPATVLVFYDQAGNAWEAALLNGLMRFSKGQRAAVPAGSLQITVESAQNQ